VIHEVCPLRMLGISTSGSWGSIARSRNT